MSIYRGMDKEDVVHIHNGILLSHKNDEKMAFAATWMSLEIIILSEVSEKENDKYHITYMWNLKYDMNLSTKQTPKSREQTCGCQGGWGLGVGRSGRLRLADAHCDAQSG